MAVVKENVRLILFDLGGVLVELADIRDMWCGKKNNCSDEELWGLWLNNEAIRAIDRGQISVDDFLLQWVRDWELEVSVEALKKIYENLIRQPFPGVMELLEDCQKKYRLACLSNMTANHWPKVKSFGLDAYFDYSFISCEMACCKPEAVAYRKVLENCPYKSEEILFVDDNEVNVREAKVSGMQAIKAKTALGVRELFEDLGVISA